MLRRLPFSLVLWSVLAKPPFIPFEIALLKLLLLDISFFSSIDGFGLFHYSVYSLLALNLPPSSILFDFVDGNTIFHVPNGHSFPWRSRSLWLIVQCFDFFSHNLILHHFPLLIDLTHLFHYNVYSLFAFNLSSSSILLRFVDGTVTSYVLNRHSLP